MPKKPGKTVVWRDMEEYEASVSKLFDGMTRLPTQKVKRTLAISDSADSIVRVTMAKQIVRKKDYNYGDVLSWLAELGFFYLSGNMGNAITKEQQLLLAGEQAKLVAELESVFDVEDQGPQASRVDKVLQPDAARISGKANFTTLPYA